ncbi:hypothetical protein EXE48_12720 [Halorubrum sp. ASP1]|uniref:hypothetical protein n=1 Tax=Halorubrum sp. ASP1 TaxID=2518114 RepID=UPI0010F847D2|nr:hypothetical protein [Halorubrum sp. ASP1]TKX60436.1 hypothetical protein EXE48_12720 [Halorubrum sp. ASP1]
MERVDWRTFEDRVKRYFEQYFGRSFIREKEWRVGQEQVHKFDSVSKDGEIVIECKSYTWVNGEDIPPAKISTLNETLLFLSRVEAERKMIVIQDDFRDSDDKSLAEYYVDHYGGLMDDVEVWSYIPQSSIEDDEVEQIRESGKVYYEEL